MKTNKLKRAYVLDDKIKEIIDLYHKIEEMPFSFFDDNGEEAEGVKLLLCEDADNTLKNICNELNVNTTTVFKVLSFNEVPENRRHCYAGWTSQDKFIYEETKF